jgi:pSer/pThr/pTyr-binding forkhead associated (FHA) protein
MTVTLQLLDSTLGHPIQTWTFQAAQQIRIGRAEGNDVIVSDPLVSRQHAELVQREGRWEVVSQGLHGTLVDGRKVESGTPLGDGNLIRLGANGPLFEFRQASLPSNTGIATVTLDNSWVQRLRVDEHQRQQEVEAIAESDTFKHLRQQAQKLRQRCIADTVPLAENNNHS